MESSQEAKGQHQNQIDALDYNFEAEGYGGLQNMQGLGIHTGPDLEFLPNDWNNLPEEGNLMGSSYMGMQIAPQQIPPLSATDFQLLQSMDTGLWQGSQQQAEEQFGEVGQEQIGEDQTAYQQNESDYGVGSHMACESLAQDTEEGMQQQPGEQGSSMLSSNDGSGYPGTTRVPSPPQFSEHCHRGFPVHTAPALPSQGTQDAINQEPIVQSPSVMPTSDESGYLGAERRAGPTQRMLPAPVSSTPTQPRPVLQRRVQEQGSRAQNSAVQSSTLQRRREQGPQAQNNVLQLSTPQRNAPRPLFPNRLSLTTSAVANTAPAVQFMESMSSMHLVDKLACLDILMKDKVFEDYVSPHLWEQHNQGIALGGRIAARRRLSLSEDVNETQRKHAGQKIERRIAFENKKIHGEVRKRRSAAVSNTSSFTTSASETGDMTHSGSKRRRQSSSSGYDRTEEHDHNPFEFESNLPVPSRHSPKKPRHLGATPSQLVNKFCSEVNMENQNPFFDDDIHRQLRSRDTLQLIDPAPEYVAQHGELSDNKVEHWRACAGQAAGIVMEQDLTCNHCNDHIEDGTVPFASCVIVDAANPAGRELQGACMNCVYLGIDQVCSLRRVYEDQTASR